MPQLVPQQPPPPDYYAGNVRYLLGEVARRSGDLLGPDERALVTAFVAADAPAQRLFARLVSRRGPWVRIDSLDYPEVGDRDAALAALAELGLVVLSPPAPADALLALLTRAEQRALFPRVRGRTKADWTACCLGHYPDPLIRQRVAAHRPWVAVAAGRAFAVCQVAFFGGDHQDLSTFIMQDLGIHRFETYDLGPATRPFRSRRELARYLAWRELAGWSRRLDELPELAPGIVRALATSPGSRTEQRARDKVLNRVGRWHERRGEIEAALAAYAHSTSHPARERRARLLRRLGDEAGVTRELAAMAADPWAPEEEDFAVRFAAPGRRRGNAAGPPVTECRLAGPTPPAIEAHALQLLTANGGRGWHLENLLPLGLAGLAFWDEIFAPVEGAFAHPFQLGPQDLFWPDFARPRREALEARRTEITAPGGLAARLWRTYRAKQGTANALVHWGALTAEVLEALLAHVPHDTLAALAAHTLFNLHRCRSGFPDLLVIYGPGAWELVEVKGPTDQLQGVQRVRLAELQALGIPARVLRFRAPC